MKLTDIYTEKEVFMNNQTQFIILAVLNTLCAIVGLSSSNVIYAMNHKGTTSINYIWLLVGLFNVMLIPLDIYYMVQS